MVVAVNDAMVKMNFNSKATKKEVIALMKLMDHNQDFRISPDEFVQFMDVFVRTRQ
jgi:Ca2+-binding EF-hand superfamily protein